MIYYRTFNLIRDTQIGRGGAGTAEDPYTHYERTQIVYVEIDVDSESDLPAMPFRNISTGYEQGTITYAVGSKAHAIAESTDWQINSSGQWIQQSPAGLANVYTKTQTDALIAAVQADADAAIASAAYNAASIDMLAAEAGKNRLTADAQTQTIDTATLTAHDDGSYTITTAAPTTQQVAFVLGTALLHAGTEYIISGISGGSNTTFFLNYDKSSSTGTGNQNIYAGGYQIATGEIERTTTVRLYIRSGQEVSITIYPMISEKKWYERSPSFCKYQITLADLYDLVKSYHS